MRWAKRIPARRKEPPAFRDLSGLYPLESLEEALAEGIVTGHDNMPEFAFEPDDINAFF
ncbi:hypothetical protein QW131_12490 [Roseibium salinum]|nr:hypothetical protein [Roseibium salinum]